MLWKRVGNVCFYWRGHKSFPNAKSLCSPEGVPGHGKVLSHPQQPLRSLCCCTPAKATGLTPHPSCAPCVILGGRTEAAGWALQGRRGAEPSTQQVCGVLELRHCPLPLAASLRQEPGCCPRGAGAEHDPATSGCFPSGCLTPGIHVALDLQSISLPRINYRLCRSCLQCHLYNLTFHSFCFASDLQEPLVNPN